MLEDYYLMINFKIKIQEWDILDLWIGKGREKERIRNTKTRTKII